MLGVTLLCPWRVFLPNPVAACLRLSPDRSQFFRYDSLLLSCESQNTSTSGWKVQKKTSEGRVRPCPTTDSTCVIRNAYPIDSGVYFCQSEGGQISNGVNITVTGTCTATGEEVDSEVVVSYLEWIRPTKFIRRAWLCCRSERAPGEPCPARLRRRCCDPALQEQVQLIQPHVPLLQRWKQSPQQFWRRDDVPSHFQVWRRSLQV